MSRKHPHFIKEFLTRTVVDFNASTKSINKPAINKLSLHAAKIRRETWRIYLVRNKNVPAARMPMVATMIKSSIREYP